MGPEEALQSLALGIGQTGGIGSEATPDIAAAFPGFASHLGLANVNIGGTSRQMFAIGLRQTLPEGTCLEALFVDPAFPPPPDQCTPPALGLVLVLWQSHSAHQPPDRVLVIITDEGTSDLSFDLSGTQIETLPGLALYVEGEDKVWASLSGTVTSHVSSLNQPCDIPIPPYAKSGACTVASFDEQADNIVLKPFTVDGLGGEPLAISIPRQTVFGLWLQITEVKPVSFPYTGSRQVPGGMAQRLGRLAPLFTRAR